MQKQRAGYVAVAVLAMASIPAAASPITADGTWYNFKTADGVDFGAGVDFAYNHTSFSGFYSNPGVPPWTFTADVFGALLTVLDGGELGDIYDVFDFGTLIGTTSFVTPAAYTCGDLPEPCLADPLMSKGFFVLAPGDHSITIAINATPYPNSFLSWFRAEQLAEPPGAIPEPGTLMLLAAGFLTMGMLRYRPQRKRR